MTAPNRTHLTLMHAPAVFDFRERPLNHWMLSKAVDTAPVFEYFPVGFITMLDYLEERGKSVRLANLAVKMQDGKFDPRRFVREQQPLLFGIDLHWCQHVDGALSLAKLCKEEHPEIPVALGGLTSTYYWREIMDTVPEVDCVLRGHTTEPLVEQLLDCLEGGREPTEVPNLAWRRNGEVVENPYTYRPTVLTTKINYQRLQKHALRTRDLKGSLLTGQHWPSTARTCCCSARGVWRTARSAAGRTGRRAGGDATLDIEVLTEALVSARQLTRNVIRMPGDIRQGDGGIPGGAEAEEVHARPAPRSVPPAGRGVLPRGGGGDPGALRYHRCDHARREAAGVVRVPI